MGNETKHVIDMTEENRPYFNAIFLLAAGIRNADAEDTLVGCVQEMLRLRAAFSALRGIAQVVVAMAEYDADDDGEWITSHDLGPWAEKARALLADTLPVMPGNEKGNA